MLSGATLDRFRPNPPLGRKEKAQILLHLNGPTKVVP
jgi:hypothetical protein